MTENSATRIALTTFSSTSLHRFASTDVDEILSKVDRDANTFMHVVNTGPAVSGRILEHFGLPSLLAEQIDNESALELDSSDRYAFKQFRFIEEVSAGAAVPRAAEGHILIRGSESDRLVERRASIIVRNNLVLLLENGQASPLLARAIETSLGRERELRERGVEYLLYRLARTLFVDNYFAFMRRMLDRLQNLEAPLLAGSTDSSLYREVARLRRELNPLERSLMHVAEFASAMAGEKATTQKGFGLLVGTFRDDRDRLDREFSMLRERTAELIETYRDNVNSQLNNIMRSLTVLSVMFMPLSFITSFYGMNFPNMPAFRWVGGFPLAVLLMLTILAGSLTYARRKKWI